FFSSRRRHTRCYRDWSSDVCSSDLQKDLRQDLIAEDGILRRLKRKVSRDDLYHTWSFNWRSQNGAADELSQWNKAKIWDYLLARSEERRVGKECRCE